MNRRLVIIFSIAAMLISGTMLVTAQSGPQARGTRTVDIEPPPLPPPPPPPPFGLPHLHHLVRELNLTEGQQAELKEFLDARRTTLEALRKKMDAEHSQLDAATAGGQFDEAQVRILATQQSQTFAELMVEHKRAEAMLYGLLTQEQRTRYEQLRQRRRPPRPPQQPLADPPDR